MALVIHHALLRLPWWRCGSQKPAIDIRYAKNLPDRNPCPEPVGDLGKSLDLDRRIETRRFRQNRQKLDLCFKLAGKSDGDPVGPLVDRCIQRGHLRPDGEEADHAEDHDDRYHRTEQQQKRGSQIGPATAYP